MISTLSIILKHADFQQDLEAARDKTNTSPTEAQIKAENYAKGVVKVRGLTIAIENPKGSTRRGTDKSGKQWEQKMAWDYGYAKGVSAVDGDKLDIFLGPDPEHGKIYVVDQVLNGKYDESKVMLGFHDEEAAREGYLANYEKGWKGLGHITEMNDEKFKTWCEGGQTEMAKLVKSAGAPGFWRSLGIGTAGALPGAAIGNLSGYGISHLLNLQNPDHARLLAAILASTGGAVGSALARELDGQFESRNWDEEGNKIRRIPTVGSPVAPASRILQRAIDIPVPGAQYP